jgi:tRNA nucleotidyltransferase/poly(A) polymerase
MQKMMVMLVVSALAVGGLARPALAIKQFSDEFMKLYDVDKKAENKSDLAKAVLEAKCYTCHQGKKSKKNRNRYGAELSKLLDKKKDAKNPEKIVEALEKVAKLHSVAKDDKSPTYGELIKAGKLPGGPLKEVKEEPKGSGSKDANKKA